MPAPDPIMIRMPKCGAQIFAEILWPLKPATPAPGLATMWGHVGQHGAADIAHWVACTLPATPEEQERALRQWRSEGPDRSEAEYPVRVLRRSPAWTAILAAHRAYLGRVV